MRQWKHWARFKTARIILVFAIYVALLPVFGGVYWRLYLRNPSNFVFAAEISQTRVEERKLQTMALVRSYSLLLDYFTAFREEFNTKELRFRRNGSVDVARLTDGRKITLERHAFNLARGGGTPEILPYARLVSPDGVVEWEGRLVHRAFLLTSFLDGDSYVRASIDPLRQLLKSSLDEQAGLESTKPIVWSFPDFLYFSAITQSTVGYGDILPNSSLVRQVVVVQLIAAHAILVLVLNFVMSSRSKAPLVTSADGGR